VLGSSVLGGDVRGDGVLRGGSLGGRGVLGGSVLDGGPRGGAKGGLRGALEGCRLDGGSVLNSLLYRTHVTLLVLNHAVLNQKKGGPAR